MQLEGAMPEPTEWHPLLPQALDEERHREAARRLWAIWREGEQPKVEEYVAAAGIDAPGDLLAVVRIDQAERYQLGQRIATETYLESFPALAQDRERAIDLIFAEYLLREAMGAAPTPDEFLERFPQYAGELKLQLELHQALVTHHMPEACAAGETISTLMPGESPGGMPQLPGYEILGVLGRGGMGIVYRAWRSELRRHVALKMVHAGAQATASVLARFRIEAEAVARLQHPNIVQIYDVGQHLGSPFLVLELIEGRNLVQRTAGTPQMAEWSAALLETLAKAIHAVHEQGVVHRDLTPANVLLTSDGIAKITDFGLAKLLDGTGELRTQTGDLLGTPSYMAPEQASSRHAEIGPATDVYALGAILYELLTGRPPFKAELPLETLRQVLTDEPVAPTRLRPKLPRDLETICLKCLQKEPRQRYSGALALAVDLRRYLDGRPIVARPSNIVERGWSWCKRNRAVAVLLAMVIGLCVTLAIGSTTAALWLKSSRDDARLQRSLADVNFRDARQAVDDSFTRVSESTLLNAPGLQPMRKGLLEDALNYYQRFVRRLGDRPGVQAELAAALDRVGQITAEIGSKEQALAYRRKARGIYQSLGAARPGDLRLQGALARTIDAIALLLGEAGQREQAVADYQAALGIQQRLVALVPGDDRLWDDLATSESGLGQVFQLLSRTEDALRCYERAVAIRGRLKAADHAVPALLNELALDLARMGRLHHDAGRDDQAIHSYNEALTLQEGLVASNREVASYRAGLATTYTLLGISLRAAKRWDEALASYQKARQSQEALVAANPSVTEYRFELAATFNDVANLERALGRRQEALRDHQRALEIRQALVAANPRFVRYQRAMAASFNAIGINQAELGRPEEALDTFRQLRDGMQMALAADPKNIDARIWLSNAWHNSGNVLVKVGRPAEAVPAFRQAIDQKRRVLADGPKLKSRIRSLGNHYLDLAEAERALGQASQAAATLWEHRALWDGDAAGLCKLARGLALCIPIAAKGQPEPITAGGPGGQKYGEWAMDALKRAVAAGYHDAAGIRDDADLGPVRERADFRALVQDLAFPDFPFAGPIGLMSGTRRE
jgi:serine/threonine-protein kinase